MPDQFAALSVDGGDADDDAKKRQKRGGKGMMKAKKKEEKVEKKILLSIAPRGKKKAVTVVQGLKTFGIDLKVASKFFGQKFACGASITGDDEIVIQGDFKDDLFDLIPEKWADVSIFFRIFRETTDFLKMIFFFIFQVDEDLIEDLGSKKRS